MAKLTMEDVNKKLEEIRARRIQQPNNIDLFLERAKNIKPRLPRVRRPI